MPVCVLAEAFPCMSLALFSVTAWSKVFKGGNFSTTVYQRKASSPVLEVDQEWHHICKSQLNRAGEREGRGEHFPRDLRLFGADEMFQHIYCMHMPANPPPLIFHQRLAYTESPKRVENYTNTKWHAKTSTLTHKTLKRVPGAHSGESIMRKRVKWKEKERVRWKGAHESDKEKKKKEHHTHWKKKDWCCKKKKKN